MSHPFEPAREPAVAAPVDRSPEAPRGAPSPGSTSDLAVASLSGAHDRAAFLAEFCALPGACRAAPYRVGLAAPGATMALLGLSLTEDREAWLVRREGRAVGRIHANASWTRTGVGYIGFYEVDLREADHEGVAALLLSLATEWLAARGRHEVYGPIDLCTWFSYRFQLPPEPGEAPSRLFAWEPVNPPEFVSHWEKSGFSVAERYHTKATRYSEAAPMAKAEDELGPTVARAMAAGYTFEPMGDAAKVMADAAHFHAVSAPGFAENFLFEPIPLELLRTWLAGAVARRDFSISWWVHAPGGVPAGFAFCFIDGDCAIGKTIVVDPAHRGKALGPSLFRFVLTTCPGKGVTTWVSALVRDGNVSDKVTRSAESYVGEAWRHRYVLLGKHGATPRGR